MSTNSLARRVTRGVGWAAAGRLAGFVTNLGVGAILAHRLQPSDFGIVAMATVCSGFLAVFADAGLRSAVIQYRELEPEELSTLFWFAALFGLFLTLVMIAMSFFITRLVPIPAVRPVIAVLAVGLSISSLGAIPGGVLQRQLRFREMALCDVAAALLAGGVAVGMVMNGARHWALIAQTLLATTTSAALWARLARWRPRLTFHLPTLRKVLGFSGHLTAFNMANYWARNIDNFLIGKYYGSASLGYYDRAYVLMLYPLTLLTSVANPVLHAILAGVQDDHARLYAAYLKTIRVTAAVSMSLAGSLGLLAPELVRTLWGRQWERTIPLFQVLCVVGAVQPIHGTGGSFFLARNRADLVLKTGLVYIATVCAGIVAGLHWGAFGVAVGYASAYTLVAFPVAVYWLAVRVLGGRVADLAAALRGPALAALGTWAAVFGWNLAFRGRLAPWLHLLGGAATAAVAFLVLIRLAMGDMAATLAGVLPGGGLAAARSWLGGGQS